LLIDTYVKIITININIDIRCEFIRGLFQKFPASLGNFWYKLNSLQQLKHTVIKYLFLKEMSGNAIHDDMLDTLGDNAPAYSIVKSWLAKFKCGRNSVEDKHRSGRPKDAASTENVQIVNDMLKEDRCLTIQHIAETTDIHATTVLDDLGMKTVSAHWVPRILTDKKYQNRVDVCTDLRCRFQAQP